MPPVAALAQICCVVLNDRYAVRRMKGLVQQNQCAKVKQQHECNCGCKVAIVLIKIKDIDIFQRGTKRISPIQSIQNQGE